MQTPNYGNRASVQGNWSKSFVDNKHLSDRFLQFDDAKPKSYLLVIRGPDSTGDLALQIDLR